MTKTAGSGSASGSGSGSISQRHGSADPDPHQNVMDPEHWIYMIGTSVRMEGRMGVRSTQEPVDSASSTAFSKYKESYNFSTAD